MPRNPTVIDQHVGARARAARLEAGKSQTEVAESSRRCTTWATHSTTSRRRSARPAGLQAARCWNGCQTF